MAATLYEVFFGTINAGRAPFFATFKNDVTNVDLAQPAFSNLGGGFFKFGVDWAAIGATQIRYAADFLADDGLPAGQEVSGTITSNPAPGLISPALRPQNLALFPTAKTVLQRASIQCGLAPVDDPYAATDPSWVLLRELLVTLGDDLMENGWPHLVQLASFATDGVSTAYALPVDYHEIEDQTLWNRSTRLPGVGPLSYQQAAYLQARLANVVFSATYQLAGGNLLFPIVPPSGSTIAFYYTSSYWVNSAASGTPDKDRPSANDDTLLFDEELLILGLKLKWLEDKGFDTAKVQDRFDSKLEHVIGKNLGGKVLSLTGPGSFDPLIDGDRNMPLTGYGV